MNNLSFKTQLVYLALDIFQKTSIGKYHKYYIDCLAMSKDELYATRLEKLKRLLKTAYENVPYYNEIFNQAGFNYIEIKELNSINVLPVLTRETLAENFEKMINSKAKHSRVKISSSSGTSGIPLRYAYDSNSISAGVAAGYFAYGLSGWHLGSKTLYIWGNPTSVKHWNSALSRGKSIITNIKKIAATDLNDPKNLVKIYDYIAKDNFDYIEGYTSSIFEMANFMKINGLPKLTVKGVYTTAENLMSHQEEIISEMLGPVTDGYGCSEVNGIAVRLPSSSKYYIMEPHLHLEVSSRDKGFGDLLVTDFFNYTMPLIRYQVGDMVSDICLGENDDSIKFDYFTKLHGRSSDIIRLPNGNNFYPVSIVGGTFFRQIRGLVKHKVIWNGKRLFFIFEINEHYDGDSAYKLVTDEYGKLEVPLMIKTTEKILPSIGGKFKYFEIDNEYEEN